MTDTAATPIPVRRALISERYRRLRGHGYAGETVASVDDTHVITSSAGSTMTAEPHCCHIGCDQPATVEIRTIRSAPPAATNFAGPDPYGDDTMACDDHVGHLLGHQPDAVNPHEIYWEVYPIAPETPPG